ncbi:MAG TPA: hypothetical protein VGN88_05170 [Phycisphaerae bacterium]|jgi:hypothetical protein
MGSSRKQMRAFKFDVVDRTMKVCGNTDSLDMSFLKNEVLDARLGGMVGDGGGGGWDQLCDGWMRQ